MYTQFFSTMKSDLPKIIAGESNIMIASFTAQNIRDDKKLLKKISDLPKSHNWIIFNFDFVTPLRQDGSCLSVFK